MEETSNRELFLQRQRYASKQPLSQSCPKMSFVCQNLSTSVIKENLSFNPEFQTKRPINLDSEITTTSPTESNSHISKHESYSFKILIQKQRDIIYRSRTPFQSLLRTFSLTKVSYVQLVEQSMEFVYRSFHQRQIGSCSFIRQQVDRDQHMAVNMNGFTPDLQKQLLKDFTVFTFNAVFQTQLINLIEVKNKQKLQEKSLVMDIVAVALDKKHMGKKLLPKMLEANQILAKKEGCKYSYIFASNFKTGIALSKLNYQIISQYPSRQFEFSGIKPYALIQNLHKNPCVWLKDLDQ